MPNLDSARYKKSNTSNNIYTLDELHKNNADVFLKKKNFLDKKKKLLENLKKHLSDLNDKKYDDDYKLDDAKKKCKLKNDIKSLEDEIYDIENDVSEMEYYSKTADILVDYYDKKKITPIFNVNDNDNINETENSNNTHSIMSSKKSNIVLTKKNTKSSKPKVSRSNPVLQSNQKRDILACLKSNSKEPISNNSNEKEENVSINLATNLKNYEFIMGYNQENSISGSSITKHCHKCNIEKIIFIAEGIFVCEKCGEIEPILIKNEKCKEVISEKVGYPYKKGNHFNEWITQFQGKETTDIPKEIFNKIYAELHKRKIYDFKKLTIAHIRNILKQLSLTSYYEHSTYILSKISKTQPPVITRETEEKLRIMFRQIQIPWIKYKPKNRQNFLSYPYVLYKFCQLLELDQFILCFPLLKSRDKLRAHDKVWELMCKDLKWEFISSV